MTPATEAAPMAQSKRSPGFAKTRRFGLMIGFGFAMAALALGGPAVAADSPPAAAPRVVIETSLGRIVVELQPARAPKTVANFLQYVKEGFYDGTVFHRVIGSFMIQGGGFTADLVEKPTHAPIPIESKNGLKNSRGAIAMARTMDPNSATAQFFIDVVDNAMLDYPSRDGYGYAVFGQVVEGMEVVDRIRAVATGQRNGMGDVPLTAVIIKSARLSQ